MRFQGDGQEWVRLNAKGFQTIHPQGHLLQTATRSESFVSRMCLCDELGSIRELLAIERWARERFHPFIVLDAVEETSSPARKILLVGPTRRSRGDDCLESDALCLIQL